MALCCTFLAAAGCGLREQRSPESVEVAVTAERGTYLLDGERVGRAALEQAMRGRAQESRDHITGSSPILVRIVAPTGSADPRARELATFLNGIGLSNVQFEAR